MKRHPGISSRQIGSAGRVLGVLISAMVGALCTMVVTAVFGRAS